MQTASFSGVYWNCHVFREGKCKGHCPYDLLGLTLPTLDWWQLLQIALEYWSKNCQLTETRVAMVTTAAIHEHNALQADYCSCSTYSMVSPLHPGHPIVGIPP